ncbi:hypothetical protein [uncultured Flavobacterium sp.]|uniref:hypothetical protein n=1 Tax=uncultured Flavobacterium sp. TaxID=165435 RepID=UPI0030EC1CDB
MKVLLYDSNSAFSILIYSMYKNLFEIKKINNKNSLLAKNVFKYDIFIVKTKEDMFILTYLMAYINNIIVLVDDKHILDDLYHLPKITIINTTVLKHEWIKNLDEVLLTSIV